MAAADTLSILYVGATSGTSAQRADALRRLGHQVTHLSPYQDLPRYWAPWLYRAGGPGIDALVARSLRRRINGQTFDLAHVDSGDVVGLKTVGVIRKAAPRVANLNLDNPYAQPAPERRRWDIFRRAIPCYDLNVAVRRTDLEQQMRALGVRNHMLIWQCADERIHAEAGEAAAAAADVVFVGTWMPGRDDFMRALIARGVPLSIYGPRWDRAPAFAEIRQAVKGAYLSGRDYTQAIAGAKVALVLLNGANNDLHTTRSVEIPAIGTVMCAPRTQHHAALYEDGREAILFDTVEDCAQACLRLLHDDSLRAAVAAAGKARTFRNETYNEPTMRRIVDTLLSLPSSSS